MKTFWRHLGALALGYLAGGLTYVILPLLLAYPAGMLSALTGTPLFDLLQVVVTLAALAVWIGVYIHFVRKWGQKAAAPNPPPAA